jgi:hypothetical protein
VQRGQGRQVDGLGHRSGPDDAHPQRPAHDITSSGRPAHLDRMIELSVCNGQEQERALTSSLLATVGG